MCRETFMARYSCDHRRDRSVIAAELGERVGDIVWVPESEEEDALWPEGESMAMAAERCYRFLLWLSSTGYREIAVGSHSHILFMMLNAVVQTDDEDLRSWFHTGEMRTVTISAQGGDVQAELARTASLPLGALSTEAASGGRPELPSHDVRGTRVLLGVEPEFNHFPRPHAELHRL